jgi:hypothetical protein
MFATVADTLDLPSSTRFLASPFKKRSSGPWIGGTTYLTEDAVIFRQALLDRLLSSVRVVVSSVLSFGEKTPYVVELCAIAFSTGLAEHQRTIGRVASVQLHSLREQPDYEQ